jgi:hypothetical protein
MTRITVSVSKEYFTGEYADPAICTIMLIIAVIAKSTFI